MEKVSKRRAGRPVFREPVGPFTQETGERIRSVRVASGLSIQQVADRTNGLLSVQALSTFETGRTEPSLSKFLALCFALACGPEALIPHQLALMLHEGNFNPKDAVALIEGKP